MYQRIKDFVKTTVRSKTPVYLGRLDSVQPVSDSFGLDRGTPIDRYYIEDFLQKNSELIRGDVLEIAEDKYSRRFGSKNVSSFQILFPNHDNPKATIVGDLSDPSGLPANRVDSFVCTQTLNFIYDVNLAVKGCHTILRDGGTLLLTVAGISQVSTYDMDRWGDYWRFTTASLRKLLEPHFEIVSMESYGNVLAATAFLQGMAVEDITDPSKLMVRDPQYQLLIACIAKKI